VTTALYRRYRPETFEEVIGQEHVTGPLMQALRSNRVNHAYLFSGPRGCGKTTSARILARILNCAQNTEESPSATPCGECESCVELGRGGAGSLDVVEIDAASHGGVDDARDLRERATFSPSRDRFKIFILDEAHMVTSAGFNALLKIVEEPPPYLKFIFATTEPEKVIGTIRSRTHHYPFRLVPPEVLQPYLEKLCGQEDVAVGRGVLPLVVRAGGGSVRDSLSILDQLMAGARGASLEYEMAAGLLGFTPVTLLDDVVEALAASDGASLFAVVDQIIATGHEPRRFVEDLLERLRDLLVIAVSGERADAVFSSMPEDQLARMRTQASNLGLAELSRAADVVNAALSEMTGATSPRLHLELLCARLLLPTADEGARGIAARVERLERGQGASTPPASTAPRSEPAPSPADQGHRTSPSPVEQGHQARVETSAPPAGLDAARPSPARPTDSRPAVGDDQEPGPQLTDQGDQAAPSSADRADPPAPSPTDQGDQAAPSPVEQGRQTSPPPVEQGRQARVETPATSPGVDTAMLRRRWDEVLATLSNLRKASWALVGGNAQVHDLGDDVLQLAFPSPGLVSTFRNGAHADVVRQSVRETLGVDVRVEAVVSDGPSAAPGPPASVAGPQVSAAVDQPTTAVRASAVGTSVGTAETPSEAVSSRPAHHDVVDPAAAAASWDLPSRAEHSRGPAPATPRESRGASTDADAEEDPARVRDEPAGARDGVVEESGSARPGADAPPVPPSAAAPPATTEEPPLDEPPLEEEPPFADEPPFPDGHRSERAGRPSVPSTRPESGRPRPAAESALPASSQARSLREAATAAVNRSTARPTAQPPAPRPEFTEEETWDSVDVDDTGGGLVGAPLVAQMLGGTVIDEIVDPEQ